MNKISIMNNKEQVKAKRFCTAVAVLLAALMVLIMVPTGGTLAAASPAEVDLGSAGNFVILAKSGISTTGTTMIVGDIGVSPIDSTGITGFGLSVDASNQFATSSLVTGKVYAADYTPPTPTTMTTAISNMETAYTDAAGRSLPDYTELGAGNIGGMTLDPGLYKWGTGLIIPTDVTISGTADSVWIFQVAQNLDISAATQVILSGGAQAKNIFWVVAGQTTIGTTAIFNGNILCQTAIVLNTGATLNGRALSQTEVTLDANAVTIPTASSTVSSTTPANGATGVASHTALSATFSEPMDPLTITTTTFTVKQGAVPVAGTVSYSGLTAVFTPASNLTASTTYTATITTGVKDLDGNASAFNKVWTFTTAAAPSSGDTPAEAFPLWATVLVIVAVIAAIGGAVYWFVKRP